MLNLRIDNKTLLASNLSLLEGQETTRLTADAASASGTLTVDNIAGFKIGNYVLIGNLGEASSEIIRIHATTSPSGSTITLASNTAFDHYSDTPVTLVNYNQIEFSRATTLTGDKTTLGQQSVTSITRVASTATVTQTAHGYGTGELITISGADQTEYNITASITYVDANTYTYTVSGTPATPATGTIKAADSTKAIGVDKLETAYVDLTNTTGYGFFRFKNDATSTYSSYCTGVSYSGLGYTSVRKIVEKACDDASVTIGGQYADENTLLNDANDAIEEITKFDWIFELVKNDTSLTATENENRYALSGLTYTPKYTGTAQGIKNVRFGANQLDKIDGNDMEGEFDGIVKTTLASDISIGATSITLSDSYEFAESGTVSVGAYTVTYTTNTEATGVLSGISAATFTGTVSSGASVWQGVSPALPTKYCIENDYIVLNKPVDTDYVGYKIKVNYLKYLTRFTDFASTTEIPFTNEMANYITAKIEGRKRNFDISDRFMKKFQDGISLKLEQYKLPTMDEQTYYHFFDDEE